MHHRGVDHHVVVDELRRARRVGQDAADGAGDEKDVLRTVGAEPVVDRRLIAQIELIARGGQDVVEPELLEATDDRGADQAAMAGDEDSGVRCPYANCKATQHWPLSIEPFCRCPAHYRSERRDAQIDLDHRGLARNRRRGRGPDDCRRPHTAEVGGEHRIALIEVAPGQDRRPVLRQLVRGRPLRRRDRLLLDQAPQDRVRVLGERRRVALRPGLRHARRRSRTHTASNRFTSSSSTRCASSGSSATTSGCIRTSAPAS